MQVRAATHAPRIQSLDGLRAVSIMLVLLCHAAATVDGPHWTSHGGQGVRVFFVISGYLITTLLFRELGKTGSVSLLKFYYRRTLRIFPPFYFYIGVVMVLAAFGLAQIPRADLVHALTYTVNYRANPAWEVGHSWSLSVEEQFYLLWPFVVLVLGRKRAIVAAALFAAVVPLIRIATYYLLPSQRPLIQTAFQTVGDSLAIGCLLAGVRDRLASISLYVKFQRSPLFVLVPFGAVGLVFMSSHTRFDLLIGQTSVDILIALIIDWCVTYPGGVVGKFLNTAPLVFLGQISYSLYLWQQIFLNRFTTSWYAQFPQNLALSLVAAVASYYIIEKPFLRLREKLEPRIFAKPVERATLPDSA